MKIEADNKFLKDLKKLKKNQQLLKRVNDKIADLGVLIADISSMKEATKVIPNIKKMQGYDFHYRIRVGDYRLGIFFDVEVNEEEDVLIFQRCLHRKDIYQDFPDE